jgi:uncharacterized repeat protein (TIGR01451 family)
MDFTLQRTQIMKKLIHLALMLLSVCSLQAQNEYWKEANAPYGVGEWGGQLTLVNANNGKLYSYVLDGAKTKVYVSADSGTIWTELKHIATAASINPGHLHIGHAGNFYAPDSTAGWSKSKDEGQSWKLIPGTGEFRKLLETKTGALIGWKWNGFDNQFFRSTDLGQSWTLQGSFPGIDMQYGFPDFEVCPFGGILGKVNQQDLNYRAIYNSTDDGLNWSRRTVVNDYDLVFTSTSGAMFFRKSNDDKLYRMSALGQPLVALPLALKFSSFTMLPSGRILSIDAPVTTSKSIQYSDNDGLDWQILTSNDDATMLQKIEALSDSSLFCSVRNGLSKSTDGGNTWEFAGYGINRGKLIKLKAVTDSIYVASTSYGLWKSEDVGQSWELLIQTKNADIIRDFETTSSGGILSINDNKLLYLPPNGNNFEDITPSQAQLSIPRIFVNPNNDHLYLKVFTGIFHSSNSGQSWTQITNFTSIRHVSFHPSGRIIVNTDVSIFYSDNNGQTWVEVIAPVFNMMVLEQTWVSPTGGVFVGMKPFSGNQPTTIAYSNDRAATWQLTGQLLASVNLSNVIVTLNDHIYLTNNDHTYLSVNKGSTWQTLPCPESPTAPDCETGHFLTLTPSNHLFLQIQSLGCYITASNVSQGAYIEGYVRIDADADCTTPDAQAPLKNRILKAEDAFYSYYTNTDSEGHYIYFLDVGTYQLELQNPNMVWWAYCQNNIEVILSEPSDTGTVNFAAIPMSYCPLISVNIGVPFLRRCFDNEVYVTYCNDGTEFADSAWVDVILDPFLTLVNSAQPHEVQSNGAIRFFVGDVPSGNCGEFQLTVYVNCDSTVLGQTHCISAHGFPDTLCTQLPTWSGANIEASVTCQDSTLKFNLKNTGTAASQTLEYIIIEDDIVLMTGQEDYNISEDLFLDFPANGKTWRIESEQEPGHPFSFLVLAFAEGCGGFESLGFINQFPVNGSSPSWHRMCVENIGAYDPNDKQGFPIGTGSAHNIRPGQTIDYLIRFQNTGTDTAFTVVIKDTLSAFLDPLNIRPGASSHAYTWSLSGQGVINFTFNNIMLPDSNVNEPASNGFVQFSITPYLDVPLGSVIENDAAIYFDFNEPVITNTTWHTIQKSPLTSALWSEPQKTTPSLLVWPNPFNERINVRLNQKTSGSLLLKIYDSRGTLVAQKTTNGQEIELNARQLPAGLYWAEVRDTQGRLVGSGKLVKD